MENNNKTHRKTFSNIPIEYSWSFRDKTIKDTSYITHGYYTYPAKFIPQLASRIIKECSAKNDIVIDPFMGSGTTVVEAIVNHRIGIGTDINEIAALLSKVKTTPIEYSLLSGEFSNLMEQLQSKLNGNFATELAEIKEHTAIHTRIDYWFKPHIRDRLLIILRTILALENADIKDFFLIVFAQILKSCSIWMQKSVKPTRDKNKKEIEPLYKFEQIAKRMIKKSNSFNDILPKTVKNNIADYRTIKNNDARNLPCKNSLAALIMTSPPYVTSYEYADLHQLPSLWLGHLDELAVFRKKFIGSSTRKRGKIDNLSDIAKNIVLHLGSNKKSVEVENYFADMLESFIEMKRVLRTGGKAAIVIGNTKLNGVNILNAEVFQEQFENIGFKTHKIIQREIPSKMLPSTRDQKTGRFAKAVSNNKTLAYPTEYILIMQKL